MRCVSCGFENPEGMVFCIECGARLQQSCPSCGFEIVARAKFCGKCGTALVVDKPLVPTKGRKYQGTTGTRKMPHREASPPVAQYFSTPPEAERRQLTVMFCDLVDSTALSAQLDPEDYRAVVQQYQQTCNAVIRQHGGYLAQYLGDGLLVYFGYPAAHEDDARRAVRTGLEIVEAIKGQARHQPLQVRIGIHTGLVVIGEIGSEEKRELLALGETPNIAARIQGLAEPNTVIISAATQQLIEGWFESQPFGSHLVKGIDTPIAVSHVQSERQSVSPIAGRTTLTPLVGREQEASLLVDRWEQAKEGRGQVVLLSGEPGIGKSRLAYTLREHVTAEGSLLFEARCLPYHQHSAFYPLLESFQRTLLLTHQETDKESVEKLERALALYAMQDALPLFTALLSLPMPLHYPPLNLTPQKQKERTLQALLQLLIAQSERQATVSVWEDLHWVDPSSLEFLSLLIEQIPTTKLLVVLTFRPEFTPPWKPRSHISQLVLNRLGKKQVEAMIEKVAVGQTLSAEVREQIRIKTDGVPLFVEELTKSVAESVKSSGRSPRQLAVPATLQEALLARLDRLSTARQVAQLGATLGREFSYELLQAVTPLSEAELKIALAKLVEAEVLYQRGVGQHTRYVFKHALIQDTAYQSLLKSTRQQYHQQIAQVLEERFPDTKNTQPELLAHHYTEAGLIEQAIPYWHTAGEQAIRRSAHAEAISHLAIALTWLKAQPDTPERTQQELRLQMALGAPLMSTKGWGSPEVERTFTRARELCQQLGETPELYGVLAGLWVFHTSGRSALQTSLELAEQLVRLAQHLDDAPFFEAAAAGMLANTLFYLGQLPAARAHFEQYIAAYDADPQRHRSLGLQLGGNDTGVTCKLYLAFTMWLLGFPDQALQQRTKALTVVQEVAYPISMALASEFAARVYTLRREGQAALEQAEAAIQLSTELGSTLLLAWSTAHRGWALGAQGQLERGIDQLRESLTICQAAENESWVPYFLALLAETQTKAGQIVEGLNTVAEALEMSNRRGDRWYEAELHRLKGMLMLQSTVPGPQSQVQGEAEECFWKAIEIARQQQAKSLELRAVMSLVRLRQQHVTPYATRNTQHETRSRLAEAHQMLSEIYHWFTEGFETKDLQEAKALLECGSEPGQEET